MSYMNDIAKVGTFGLLGSQLFKNKKKPPAPQSTMISTTPYERPMTMIGGGRR